MGNNQIKQPGKILMPYFKCLKCGTVNDMPQFATRPGMTFSFCLSNERGMGINKSMGDIKFVCMECKAAFVVGMKEYKEPKISN